MFCSPLTGALEVSQLAMTKNTADVRTVASVMRSILGESYELPDTPDTYDGIAEKWHALLRQLLLKTPRLNTKVLADAALLAFDIPLCKGLPWARSLVDCVSYCRVKMKSVTSGKKLNPAVFAIVSQLGVADRKQARGLWPGGVRSAAARLSPKKSPKLSESPCKPTAQKSWMHDAAAIADMYTLTPLASDRSCVAVDSISEPPSQGGHSSCAVVSSESADEQHSQNRCYVDSQQLAVVKVVKNGATESAKLVAGPDGFAVAHFKDGTTHVSECPNLMLTLPLKRPAAAFEEDERNSNSESLSGASCMPMKKKQPPPRPSSKNQQVLHQQPKCLLLLANRNTPANPRMH